MTDKLRNSYLFLSLLQARTGHSLISRLGDLPPEEFPDLSAAELSGRVRMTERALRAFEELRASFDPDKVLARLAEKDAVAVTLADDSYPELLKEIPDPPPALFVRGELPEVSGVALVGSRKASATGLDAAREIGRALGRRGACVVSGLALGIDAAAHEGALEAGGPTVGVLGCGIDIVYPRKNAGLFEKVREGGAVVSEYYLGEAPLAWRFPARNRIIAGLCEHLVVVEAAERSGALITARHALDSGREVWAAPGPMGALECRGSNKLLADGAGVLWDVEEFAEALVGLEREELYSWGIMGLLDAIETFDPERGARFETYAISKIRWAMLDEIRKRDWVPRRVRTQAQEADRAVGALTQKLGRAPDDGEVAGELGVSLAEYRLFQERLHRARITSLEARLEADGNLGAGVQLLAGSADAHDPQAEADLGAVKEQLVAAIRDLKEQERIVTTFYFYEDLTLKEIGKALNLSEGRISQILRSSILKLRECLTKGSPLYEGF